MTYIGHQSLCSSLFSETDVLFSSGTNSCDAGSAAVNADAVITVASISADIFFLKLLSVMFSAPLLFSMIKVYPADVRKV